MALGVSAIGRVGATYSQNAKTLEDYYDHLDQGRLPIVRGLALSRDDLLRRGVIMALMCQGHLDFESAGLAHGPVKVRPLTLRGSAERPKVRRASGVWVGG